MVELRPVVGVSEEHPEFRPLGPSDVVGLAFVDRGLQVDASDDEDARRVSLVSEISLALLLRKLLLADEGHNFHHL